MTPDQFTNWLSGFISALGSNQPTNEQFNLVKDNLEKVFNKVTSNRKEEKFFERHVVPDCDLVKNDGVLGGHVLVSNIDNPSDPTVLTIEDLNQFFKECTLDTSTRALLENYTGPFDVEAQLITC